MYRLHIDSGVINVESGEHIKPLRSDSRWQAYQAWLKAGNTPAPADVELESIESIRSRLKNEIDQERNRRHALPIEFDGSLFDADAKARENINGVMQRLLRGDGLPAGWVGWRDFSNAMHWGSLNAADVQAKLGGLASAIEDRKQALMISAWTKKSYVDQADREALALFDVKANW